MSQHDLDVANAAGASFRSDLNNALAALGTLQSGASAPSTTFAYMLWADTTNGLLKQRNAANSGWIVRAALAESFVLSRSSNTILAGADLGKAIIATAAFTQTLTAAATLGDGWFCDYNAQGYSIVLDPNGSETIDGAATKTVTGSGRIYCNGSAFFTIGFPAAAASGGAVVAAARNVAIKNNSGSPNSQIDITADEVALEDSSNAYYTARSVSVTVNIASSGANGLDTGAEASGTWYYLWLIYNGTTVAGLISTSSTAPTMPSGYTYKALIGVARNDGSSNFLVFQQFNREWRCADQTVFSATTGSTSYSSQSISAYVPPVARVVYGNFGSDAVVGVRAIAIASDANGLGAVRGITGSSGGLDSWRGPMAYRLILNASQNLHWKTEVADASSYRLSVNGFEF